MYMCVYVYVYVCMCVCILKLLQPVATARKTAVKHLHTASTTTTTTTAATTETTSPVVLADIVLEYEKLKTRFEVEEKSKLELDKIQKKKE